jgi:hypothetical protein
MASEITRFPLTGPINLEVKLGHGSVTVAANEELSEATVRLTPRNRGSDAVDRLTVELRGQTLVVSGPHNGGLADLFGAWRGDRDSVDAVVEVPTGTPVKIASAGDDISVTGQCGDADIATGSARIGLDTVAGNLRLRYGHANIQVGTVLGSARVSAGNGAAHFGEVAGPLDCKFGTGELTADVLRGGVRSRAGRASAHIGAVYGDVDLAFGSGSISIGVPAGVSAHVDITSGTGDAVSDLPVEDSPAAAAQTITLRARTGSGEVRLQRAVAAA